MTKAELLRRLADLASSMDAEAAHAEADHLLLDYINDIEIATAYEAVPQW